MPKKEKGTKKIDIENTDKNINIDKFNEILKKHKLGIIAIAFSILMFSAGLYGFIDYIKTSNLAVDDIEKVEGACASIVVQNNPLIVQATSVCDLENNGNVAGKLSINPAITPLVNSQVLSVNERDLNSVSISLAPSMKNIHKDIKNACVFDSKKVVYEMIIDGKVVASFNNPDDARQVVDNILEQSRDKDAELLSLEYKESFKIEQVERSFLNRAKTYTVEDAVAYLMTGTKEEHQYSVEPGDIPESIAEAHGMTLEELEKANPQIVGKGHLLQVGQKLNLEVPVPMLTLTTVERQEYSDFLPFETTEETSEDLYEGESRIRVLGQEGERQVIAEVKKENGREISRTIISEEVISEPVGQVVVLGTKPAPPKKGTGTLDLPLSRGVYAVTSLYGPRWGRMHNGIDLGAPIGTPIYAADGGDVIFAGEFGGYGYMVQIDHGGNIKTYYAHCSAIHVSEGDKVFQGQHIADVGNTGWSTGPHLHFEVRKHDVPVDPQNFLGF